MKVYDIYTRRRREHRVLPHDLESERAVLGMMMLDRETAREIIDTIDSAVFYRECHSVLFELLESMFAKGDPMEMVAVVTKIKAGKVDSDVYNGLSYVSSLPDNVPSTENPGYYCNILLELHERREVATGTSEVMEGVLDGSLTLPQALEQLATLSKRTAPGASGAVPVGQVAQAGWARVEQEYAGLRRVYLPTGIAVLDNDPEFGGWSPEGTTLIIGASGMGKTSLLNRVGLSLSDQGFRTGMYGTETSVNRRMKDLRSSVAAMNMRQWASGAAQRATAHENGWHLPHEERMRQMLEAQRKATMRLEQLPLVLFESGLTVDQFASQVRKEHRKHGLHALVVDYLQGFVASRLAGTGKTEQVSHSSKVLADLSAELEIPLIVGSQRSGEKQIQLSAQTQNWEILRPQMTDAQHASAAFQDAEEVYTLYRRDYYAMRQPELITMLPGREGEIELIARKRRVGELLTWHLPFHGPSKWVGTRDGWRL